ncbi:MAG: hypothetical protein NVS4B8_14580 [Herpetosiphon sp.]
MTGLPVEAAEPAGKPRRVFGMTLGDFIARFGALFGLAILVIFLSISSPSFLTVGNLSNVAKQATVNALLAIGLLLAIITSGIDLSVGSVLAVSMSALAVVTIKWGMNQYLGIVVGLLCGLGFGAINGLLLTKLRLPHPFIATLGTLNIARGVALVITGAAPISGFERVGANVIPLLGAGSLGPIPLAFLIVVVVYVMFHIILQRTVFGRHIYAVGGNVVSARLSGVNVNRTLLLVYSLSGLMAGLAGLLLADRTKGQNVAENLLTANPDLKAIYATNDEMALGAVQAAKSAGKQIIIVGFDASPDALTAIQSGQMSGSIAQFAEKIGLLGTITAAKVARGEAVEKFVNTGVELVTKDNVSKFKK